MISCNVIAVMEAMHLHLTTRMSLYVEISHARDRAELVTDDAKALREQLEAVTGEWIAARERIGETKCEGRVKAADGSQIGDERTERWTDPIEREGLSSPEEERGAPVSERGQSRDLWLDL